MDAQVVSNLKNSCFAIGLTHKDKSIPLLIAGSGFMIRANGIFATADHVIDSIFEQGRTLLKEGIKTDLRIFYNEKCSDTQSQLVAEKITMGYGLNEALYAKPNEKPITLYPDLYIGIVGSKKTKAFLNFEESTKISVFDQVLMCGYPNGPQSIQLDSHIGTRWSPLLQPGIISSLLPVDESTLPYGIQTNIIGTSGSSGSPIVNAHTGTVLGLAQNVILAETTNPNIQAKIGLTYGFCNYFLADTIKNMINKLESEIDENGKPLPGITNNTKFIQNTVTDLSDVYTQK